MPQPEFEYDLAIHIRLDDIFEDIAKYYTVLPLSFYAKVLNFINLSSNSKLIVVCTKPQNDVHHYVLYNTLNYLRSRYKNVMLQQGSIEEDYNAIMKSKRLVGSTGTFWFWPSFISRQEEIHVPNWGAMTDQFLVLDEFNLNNVVIIHPSCKQVYNIKDQYSVYIYPEEFEKITKESLHMLHE